MGIGGVTRIVTELSSNFHQRIKIKCAQEGISIKGLVVSLLEKWLEEPVKERNPKNPLHEPPAPSKGFIRRHGVRLESPKLEEVPPIKLTHEVP